MQPFANSPRHFPDAEFDLVAIGASLGGLRALQQVLSALPVDFPAAIMLVQHLHRAYPSQFAELLDRHVALRVKWAEHRERLRPATVYVAPPDYHLLANPDGRLTLSQAPHLHYARPSVSRLFESVAATYHQRAIGVVLTGMGRDGASGVQALKKQGGRVLVQSPITCEANSMPVAAIRTGSVDFALPLQGISSALVTLVMVPGAASLFTVSPPAA